MSKDSSNPFARPEIPYLYTPLRRMLVILKEETASLEKVLESKHCQNSNLEPFCLFVCDALKEIKAGESMLKIVFKNLEEDRRFWGETEEIKESEFKIEEKENRR